MAPHGKIFNLKIIWNFFLGLNSKLLCHTPNCPVTLQITLSHLKLPCDWNFQIVLWIKNFASYSWCLKEIASVVRGSKRIWKKINSNQRSNSIQFSSEADRPRSWIELNLIWGLNLFSFKMSLLPRTTEAIYFKHHE